MSGLASCARAACGIVNAARLHQVDSPSRRAKLAEALQGMPTPIQQCPGASPEESVAVSDPLLLAAIGKTHALLFCWGSQQATCQSSCRAWERD